MKADVFLQASFWICVFVFVYAYGGYAVLLRALGGLARLLPERNADYRPLVSIFVPAHDEESVIARKIENCRALTYPSDQLDIMICSDCSTDRTVAIARSYESGNVRVLDFRRRSGKTGMINAAVPQARGEIVVLTDANTMFAPDALAKMVACYSSKSVGAVLGQVRLRVPEGGRGIEKEVAYRDFEADLKYHEGLFGAAIGAFGGFYSIRKELFRPLPPNAYSNDDLLTPMQVLRQGYRVLFDKEAVSYEETGMTVEEEFGRRVRIGAGNFQSFFLLLPMLNPLQGVPWFFYVSHKVLRWFSPFILILLLALNLALAGKPPYGAILAGQGACYAAGLFGGILLRQGRTVPILTSICHFLSMNTAVLIGFFRYLRGIDSAAWQSTQRT